MPFFPRTSKIIPFLEKNPLVSVIVPVYNAADSLPLCIDSILAQDFGDFEAIFVDDGSTDDSPEILREYASRDSRVCIYSGRHAGPGAARNAAMKIARAPWLAFIDADDYATPDYLSILLGLSPEARFELSPGDYVITGCMRENTDDGTRQPDYFFPEIKVGADIDVEAQDSLILQEGMPSSRLVDAAIVREKGIQFPEDINLHEDHCFHLNCLLACKRLVLVPGMPYFYCHSSNSTSLTSQTHPTENMIKAAEYMMDAMLALHERYPKMHDGAFRRGFTLYGVMQILAAYRNAPSRKEKMAARAAIFRRASDIQKNYRKLNGEAVVSRTLGILLGL